MNKMSKRVKETGRGREVEEEAEDEDEAEGEDKGMCNGSRRLNKRTKIKEGDQKCGP